MPPSGFRENLARTDIQCALGKCFLGLLLVAESPRGVCAIFVGSDRQKLLREARRRFPAARLTRNQAALRFALGKVVDFVERPSGRFPLPLDIRGTPFEHLVWQTLRSIPPGKTATYAEIARKIGRPRAFRAVGRACAANCLAVAIPCHRAIGADGSLTGYRWGLARKHALLTRESPEALV